MRQKIVAGNWKMNLSKSEAVSLYQQLNDEKNTSLAKLIVFPTAIYMDALTSMNGAISVGAQNFYPTDKGAFTGEVSPSQLKSVQAEYVLIGHSERRMILNESNAFIKQKVDVAIENDLKVIFCCGEPLEARENGSYVQFVSQQLQQNIFHLSAEDFSKLVIAYEPIWAIGTGKTATAQQAEEMHWAIRSEIEKHYNADIANSTTILYGGSCNPTNAQELFACPNVDGGLIGNAALNATDFLKIASSF